MEVSGSWHRVDIHFSLLTGTRNVRKQTSKKTFMHLITETPI